METPEVLPTKIVVGRTDPAAWRAEGDRVIFVDVVTSSYNFTTIPVYVTSLGGNAEPQQVVGRTSLYPPGDPPADRSAESRHPKGPTKEGFRVRVNFAKGGLLSPAQAQSGFWHINWITIEL